MRLRVTICALGLGLAGARTAAAASEAGVRVEVADGCTRVDRAQLGRLLNVEQRRDADSGVEQARVSVDCEGEVVSLRVEERGDVSLPRTRTLKASDVAGEVGARVLALAAIELLNARGAAPEPEHRPEPEPERSAAAAPSAARRAPLPAVRLMALLAVRSFHAQEPFAGYGLSVDYLRLSRFGLKLDFDVAIDDRRYELGSAHLQLMTLSAQAGYLVLQNSWWAHIFGGYRFGSGRITGESAAGVGASVGTVAGPCGGPLVAMALGSSYGIWSFGLGAEAGLVSFPLEGQVEGHDPISLNRYWLGTSLSVGALL